MADSKEIYVIIKGHYSSTIVMGYTGSEEDAVKICNLKNVQELATRQGFYFGDEWHYDAIGHITNCEDVQDIIGEVYHAQKFSCQYE